MYYEVNPIPQSFDTSEWNLDDAFFRIEDKAEQFSYLGWFLGTFFRMSDKTLAAMSSLTFLDAAIAVSKDFSAHASSSK